MRHSIKILIAIQLLGFVSSIEVSREKQWSTFKSGFNKSYSSDSEEAKRREIFEKRSAEIDRFNREDAASRGYTMAVNSMADWTESELASLGGAQLLHSPLSAINDEANMLKIISSLPMRNLPKSLDWSSKGRVGKVGNQGGNSGSLCGSCWAFATTGVLEGQISKFGELKELSEQYLMDCFRGEGCKGGVPADALRFIKKNGGRIPTDENYPYEGKNQFCRAEAPLEDLQLGDFIVINTSKYNELILRSMVYHFGPTIVTMPWWNSGDDGFVFYNDGVFECAGDNVWNANRTNGHALLIVGYGTDEELGDYWLLKNSWGTNWGLDGYAKLSRRAENVCNFVSSIAIKPMYF